MVLNELVSYCNNEYEQSDDVCSCVGCENKCKGSCESCLEDIHFGNTRRYNCINMMNYYVCKYGYKYSSEIANIFFYNNLIDDKDNINMISIGCGPCTDLLGVNEYIKNSGLEIELRYFGIDLNKKWKFVHEYIENNFNEIKTEFIYEDAFNVFEELNSVEKCDILFLQYLLSDMVKHYNADEMDDFVEDLVDIIIGNMERGSYVIINDINHCDTRKYFERVLQKMNRNNINYKCAKLHYDNSARATHYNYGEEYADNDLVCNVPENIQLNYNPWMFCSSAQLIIKRM